MSDLKTYYLSFVDPEGGVWLGGLYIKAADPEDALRASHEIGQNPGGEVLLAEIKEEAAKAYPDSLYDTLYPTTNDFRAALRAAGLDDALTRGDGSPL